MTTYLHNTDATSLLQNTALSPNGHAATWYPGDPLKLTTCACFRGQKRPATLRRFGHYTPDIFPEGRHQPFEGLPDSDLAIVLARHLGFSAIDLDLYKDEARAKWEAPNPLRELADRRGWKTFITRSDEPRSQKYLLFWPPGMRDWWPSAGTIPGGEMRSAGLIPAPGAVHHDKDGNLDGTYVLVPGTDKVIAPSGMTYAANVIIVDDEVIAALKAAGLREQGDPGQASASFDEVTGDWGTEAVPDDHVQYVLGKEWAEGRRNSALYAVMLRMMSYAERLPGSAMTVYAQVQASYGSDPRYGATAEKDCERALVNAAGKFVPYAEYSAGADGGFPGLMPSAPAVTAPAGDFWAATPFLMHVRTAAWSRMTSPMAVLLACLARLSGLYVPWNLYADLGLGPTSLSVFSAVMGTSSQGKTLAMRVAADLLPMPPERETCGTRVAPPGSGEGLAHLYLAKEKDLTSAGSKGGRPKEYLVQKTNNALLQADEGATFNSLADRAGSTFCAQLRSAWSGEPIGASNVVENRYVITHYALGFNAAFQPAVLSKLLSQGDLGTPQRFLFADAADPSIPRDRPPWPGQWPMGQRHDPLDRQQVLFPVSCVDELQEHRYQVATGRLEPPVLDGKMLEYRVRIAALLAYTTGSDRAALLEWQLARAIWESSVAVRDRYASQATELDQRMDASLGRRLARQEAAKRDALADTAAVAHEQAVGQARAYIEKNPGATDGIVWGKGVAGRLRKLADKAEVLADARVS